MTPLPDDPVGTELSGTIEPILGELAVGYPDATSKPATVPISVHITMSPMNTFIIFLFIFIPPPLLHYSTGLYRWD